MMRIRGHMGDPSYDLFLSYAGEDLAIAERLYDLLETRTKTFLASKSLTDGDDWQQEIPRAQRAAMATVILFSSRWDVADFQRDEALRARDLRKENPDLHRTVVVYLVERPAVLPMGLAAVHSSFDAQDGDLERVARKLHDLAATLRSRRPPPLPEDAAESDAVQKEDRARVRRRRNGNPARALAAAYGLGSIALRMLVLGHPRDGLIASAVDPGFTAMSVFVLPFALGLLVRDFPRPTLQAAGKNHWFVLLAAGAAVVTLCVAGEDIRKTACAGDGISSPEIYGSAELREDLLHLRELELCALRSGSRACPTARPDEPQDDDKGRREKYVSRVDRDRKNGCTYFAFTSPYAWYGAAGTLVAAATALLVALLSVSPSFVPPEGDGENQSRQLEKPFYWRSHSKICALLSLWFLLLSLSQYYLSFFTEVPNRMLIVGTLVAFVSLLARLATEPPTSVMKMLATGVHGAVVVVSLVTAIAAFRNDPRLRSFAMSLFALDWPVVLLLYVALLVVAFLLTRDPWKARDPR